MLGVTGSFFLRYLQSNHFDRACETVIKSKACAVIRLFQNKRGQKLSTTISQGLILFILFFIFLKKILFIYF